MHTEYHKKANRLLSASIFQKFLPVLLVTYRRKAIVESIATYNCVHLISKCVEADFDRHPFFELISRDCFRRGSRIKKKKSFILRNGMGRHSSSAHSRRDRQVVTRVRIHSCNRTSGSCTETHARVMRKEILTDDF